MDWLPASEGYVIAVTDAAEVLRSASREELAVLIRSFGRALAAYRDPIAAGEWWDRPAIPFHVVLQVDVDSSVSLRSWSDQGASLKALELP